MNRINIAWKVCRTCGGKGFTKPNGEQVNAFKGRDSDPTIVCADCNGQGLEVNKDLDSTRKEV